MHISFSPMRQDEMLTVVKQGDILTINGEEFDFSTVPDGATVVAGSVPSEWIVGSIDRIDGVLHLTLVVPHGPNPPSEVAFPAPLENVPDGPIAIPGGGNGVDA